MTHHVLDEEERLRAVAGLHLVGAEPEERFDRITRTVQRLLDVPMAFLNLVDRDVLWMTSCVGFPGRSVDRDTAFCGQVLTAAGVLMVPDTTRDARFRDSPMVTAAPGIRAYAGLPLRALTGHVVGTLCAMDVVPRDWAPEDAQALVDLSFWAESELSRREVEGRLAEGEAVRRQHEQVLLHAGQGIVGIDADGVVCVANPAAADLTGWGDGLVGRPFHDTVHSPTATTGPCRDNACLLGPGALHSAAPLRGRVVLHRRDGSELPAQVSVAVMREDDAVAGAVVVFDDVSEQQAVDRMKDEFVSVVSHELRTPLTALRGSLGLLAGGVLGELTPQGKHMADVAVSSTDRLVRLVDDILDLERLVAGKVVLQRREHDVRQLAEQAVLIVSPLAERAEVALRLAAAPLLAWLDGDRVTQVLVNLLGNAVKFSPAGSSVDVRVQRSSHGIVIDVADRGRGIPEEQLERVFDRFAQVDSSDSREKGGTGLGLAITRSVVEAHGGSLTVRSDVGEGTTFTVLLPQRTSRTAPRPHGRRAADGTPS